MFNARKPGRGYVPANKRKFNDDHKFFGDRPPVKHGFKGSPSDDRGYGKFVKRPRSQEREVIRERPRQEGWSPHGERSRNSPRHKRNLNGSPLGRRRTERPVPPGNSKSGPIVKKGRGGPPPRTEWDPRDSRPIRGPERDEEVPFRSNRGHVPRGRSPQEGQPRETRNPRLRNERNFEENRFPPRDDRNLNYSDDRPFPRPGPRSKDSYIKPRRQGSPRTDRNGGGPPMIDKNAPFRHRSPGPQRRRSLSPLPNKSKLPRHQPYGSPERRPPPRGRSPIAYEHGPPPRKRASSIENGSRMLPRSIVREALIRRNQSPLNRSPPPNNQINDGYGKKPRQGRRREENDIFSPPGTGFNRRSAPNFEPELENRGRGKPAFSPGRPRGRPGQRAASPPPAYGPPRPIEHPPSRSAGFSPPRSRGPPAERGYTSRAMDAEIHNLLKLNEGRRIEPLMDFPARSQPPKNRREVEIVRERDRSPLNHGRGRRPALSPRPEHRRRSPPSRHHGNFGRDVYEDIWIREVHNELPTHMAGPIKQGWI